MSPTVNDKIMSQDLFDILSDASQNSSLNPLLFYIAEIITALTQLNLAFQSVDYYKKNLDGWSVSFPPAGELRVNKNGQMRLLSVAEHGEHVWNLLRRSCATAVTPLNIYIKSIRTLENKLALLINKKDNLGWKENELFPLDVRGDDKISIAGKKILSFFQEQPNSSVILKYRNDMEHRKSTINQHILFFLNPQSPKVSDFKSKMEYLKDITKKVYDSHLEIHNVLLPQLLNYLSNGI